MQNTQPNLVRVCGRFVSALSIVALVALIATPRTVRAGAFALTEQNAVGLGSGYSSAAVAADASTTYFNPAGLAYLKSPQAIVVAHVIKLDAHFKDAGSNTAGILPIGGNDGGNFGATELIPNVYYAHPINNSATIGVGLSAPWGLQTDYADGWVGRYHALKTRLESINLNPSIGFRVTDSLSLGAGLDIQRVNAEISNAIDFGLIGYSMSIPGFAPGSADAKVAIKGHSVKYSWNAALLYEIAPGTRIGVSYRAGITHDIKGGATFTNVPAPFAPAFPNQDAGARLPVPDIWSVHVMHDFNAHWLFTADYSLFGFSSMKSIDIDFSNPATQDSSLVQNWRDAAIISAAAHYKVSDALTIRAGYVYNESPVTNAALRSPRIPDSNRHWVTVGFSWKATDHFNLDGGYARVNFSDAPIATTDDFGHTLLGKAELSADVLSVQGTWSF